MEGNESTLPRLKRLAEYIGADPAIRNAAANRDLVLFQDLVGSKNTLGIDLELAVPALAMYRIRSSEGMESNPYYAMLRDHDAEKLKRFRSLLAQRVFCDAGLKAFNRVVYNRTRVETPVFRLNPQIELIPAIFELSAGCSVQCCFCGVSAGKHTADFRADLGNEELFRNILAVTRELIGDAAANGACYFATEPFDNPDYERFLDIFKEVFGCFPQTTTAIAERDPARTRALMKHLGDEGLKDHALRFSVRSLKQFYAIMELFSAEELADIELLFNNLESDVPFSDSGKVRELSDSVRKNLSLRPYSIVCLAGICVNLAAKTIRWLEPELPCDEYPSGFRVLEETGFQTAEEYRTAVRRLIKAYAAPEVDSGRSIYITPGVELVREGNMVILKTTGARLKVTGNKHFLDSLDVLSEERLTFGELCKRLGLGSYLAGELKKKLQPLYEKGYIRC